MTVYYWASGGGGGRVHDGTRTSPSAGTGGGYGGAFNEAGGATVDDRGGGGGGGYGQTGGDGDRNLETSSGASGGNAVTLNSNVVTWGGTFSTSFSTHVFGAVV